MSINVWKTIVMASITSSTYSLWFVQVLAVLWRVNFNSFRLSTKSWGHSMSMSIVPGKLWIFFQMRKLARRKKWSKDSTFEKCKGWTSNLHLEVEGQAAGWFDAWLRFQNVKGLLQASQKKVFSHPGAAWEDSEIITSSSSGRERPRR